MMKNGKVRGRGKTLIIITILVLVLSSLSLLSVFIVPIQAVNNLGEEDFDGDFLHGNLLSVDELSPDTFDIIGERDNGDGRRNFFLFNITQDAQDVEMNFEYVTNRAGYMTYLPMHPVYSEDHGVTWTKVDDFVFTYGDPPYTLKFSVTPTTDHVLIAAYYPQFYSDFSNGDVDDLQDYVDSVNGTHGVTVESWDSSWDNHQVYLFTVGTNYSKPTVWIMAGQHPSELWAQWAVRGILDEVIANHTLHNSYVWKIVPMINPDGNTNGRTRAWEAGDGTNLNQNWNNVDDYPSSETAWSENQGLYDAMTDWIDSGYSVDVIIDSHTDYEWGTQPSSWDYSFGLASSFVSTHDGVYNDWDEVSAFTTDLEAVTDWWSVGGSHPSAWAGSSNFLAWAFCDDVYGNPNALRVPVYFLLEQPQAYDDLEEGWPYDHSMSKSTLKAFGVTWGTSIADSINNQIESYDDPCEEGNYMTASDWEDFWSTEVISYADDVIDVTLEVQVDHQKGDAWITSGAGGDAKQIWSQYAYLGLRSKEIAYFRREGISLRFPNLGSLLPSENVIIDSATVKVYGESYSYYGYPPPWIQTTGATFVSEVTGYFDGKSLGEGILQQRDQTSAVNWTIDNWSEEWHESSDISAVLQELYDSPSWDGHVALQIREFSFSEGNDWEKFQDNVRRIELFAKSGLNCPKLELTYHYNLSIILENLYTPDQSVEEWETFWEDTILPLVDPIFTVNTVLEPEENEHDVERYHDGTTFKMAYYAGTSYVGNDDAMSPDHDEQCTFMRFTYAGAVLPNEPVINYAYLNLYMSDGDGGTSTVTADVTVAEDGKSLTYGDPCSRTLVTSGSETWVLSNLDGYSWETGPSLVDQTYDLVDLIGWDGHFCIGVEQTATSSGTLNKNIKTWESTYEPQFKISWSLNELSEFETLLSDYKIANEFD